MHTHDQPDPAGRWELVPYPDSITCEECGRQIHGRLDGGHRYMTARGWFCGPRCAAQAFATKCAYCRNPVTTDDYRDFGYDPTITDDKGVYCGKTCHDSCYRDPSARE